MTMRRHVAAGAAAPAPLPRRDWLRQAIAGTALFLPGPLAQVWAQTPQGAQLLKLPKVALVIGNSRYRVSPLRNPVNDARAIGETLVSLGFEVTVRLDADRAAMTAAVAAHVERLAAQKCVGLFYYAGHGLQLAWKNYLLPVDASVGAVGDVPVQGMELNALIAGLTRAANPLNLIILDACRDNPFGSLAQLEQKGLSQMDAPPGTLLAYATAPGNTASDGEGANGLYTENLLKEMRVREAKVEDVFKRVRLAVRRASKGAQVPWESTSLEDDFYFAPPGSLARPDDAERARRFAEELKLWESIQEAAVPAPFENYLRQYPSGQFSELAQLQLERLLAREGEKPVQPVSSKGNPYTAGSARADTAFRVGDTWTYRVYERHSGTEKGRRT
ncbi:MAG: caspase family protein, partial [Burkholderiales bacterium]|nr:caspase family protein [Burkholderiales bacterium]